MNRKRLIVIAAIIVILAGAALYFLLPKHSEKPSGNKALPTKTVVPQGETVVPDQDKPDNGSGSTPTPSTSPVPTPSVQDFYNTILKGGGIAADADGQVRFGITTVKQPLPGWFVVTVVKTGIEPNKVILRETGNSSNSLTIVAGPGTSFPPQYVSLPDAVRKAL